MMSTICLKTEKSKCSIGCFVESAGTGGGHARLQYTVTEKRVSLNELYFKLLYHRVIKDHRSIKQ